MSQISFQSSAELSWAVGLDTSNFTIALEPSHREIWLHHLRHLSEFIGHGNLHLVCMVVSLISLLFSICKVSKINTAKTRLETPSEQFLSFTFALPQAICSAVALSLSLYSTVQSGPWKESAVLTYVFILCVARFVFKSTTWRSITYHHMNAVAGSAGLLVAVKSLLPLTIMGSRVHLSTLESLKLAFIAGLLFTSFISPRSRRNKESNTEDMTLASTPSPEETCSWFSYYLSYEWLTYVILRGFSRDLVIEDLPALPSYDMPLLLLQRLRNVRMRGWKTFWTLCTMYKNDIRVILIWAVLTATIEYVAPFAMFNLLRYLERPDLDANIIHPFVWIALLFLGPMTRSVCYQQSIFKSTRLLVLSRATVIQEIYNRLLKSRADDTLQMTTDKQYGTRTPDAPREDPLDCPTSSSIKTESLVSYDADMISNASDMFYAFTASAVSTIMAMTFLYQLLGWPSLLGVLVLVVLTPLPALFSGRLSRMHKFVMEATDARLSKISEYLNSIRTLKYFAWEPIVSESITKIRLTEQQRIWKRNIASMLVAMTGDMLSLVSLLAMFTSLVLFTDRPLRAPAAFTSLAVTETLRSQYVWLSKVVQWVAQARESVQRVDKFLETAVEKQRHPSGVPEFKSATFSVSAHSPFRLQDLSISFRENALNVITGATGSGKTSLLLSLLGETILESGEASCPPDVAYVPQTAWLQNSTIRQNILFYSAFDEVRYNEVIAACDLGNDLAQLPLGDSTPVGERGSALSGGQKQRISLARALYSSASTLFLDDIFSALDTHTTSQVYSRCFLSGLLAGRTVILITHLPAAVQRAELVVALDHGRVSFIRNCSDIQPDSASSESHEEHGLSVDNISNSTASVESDEYIPETEDVRQVSQLQDVADMEHEERRASGRVPRSMIFNYMLLFGGLPNAILAICSAMMVQVAYFSITLWLSIWTGSSAEDSSNTIKYLLVYIGTVVAFVSLQFLNNFIYQRGGWHAAKTMHQRLVTAVIGAPITWFDRTPIGQILNRFGLDTQSMDAVLVDWLRMTLDNGLRFLLRLASIASIMPIFALPAGFFCMIGFATGELYSRAEISVKRLVAVKFAPVFSHFNDTSAGLSVIRGRQMEGVFQKLLADKLAQHMRAAEAQFNCNRWVSVRSDFCAATIAATAGCIAYYKSGSAGLVGFSLTNAIGLSQTILTLVRNMNELEVELNSFQRISDYTRIEPEESEEKRKELQKNNVPASWPSSGRIEFSGVTVRYTPDGPDVLRDINLVARPGERIAVIGRTGSGKSTLALSLLRSTHIASGSVSIDGIDLRRIPLQRLRQSIGLIPQDPMLFSGDVQSNLDPAGEMDETELQSVLSACNLVATQRDGGKRQSLELSIHTPVTDGGKNFSNGQRQIFGLARAICRRSKVVIMDEATASVDHETDKHMQEIIRSEFSGSTIITIAHRLRTIMDYDRVIVMGEGKVLEMGSPLHLIKAEGVFWDMLRNSGEYDELVALAGLGE